MFSSGLRHLLLGGLDTHTRYTLRHTHTYINTIIKKGVSLWANCSVSAPPPAPRPSYVPRQYTSPHISHPSKGTPTSIPNPEWTCPWARGELCYLKGIMDYRGLWITEFHITDFCPGDGWIVVDHVLLCSWLVLQWRGDYDPQTGNRLRLSLCLLFSCPPPPASLPSLLSVYMCVLDPNPELFLLLD